MKHGTVQPGRDPNRPQLINYTRISQAEQYYTHLGYTPTPVAWVVPYTPYHTTIPPDVDAYGTLGGYLVASGEQSFIHHMLEGQQLGKAQCTTPCFRDEIHDSTHDPYFLKVELINTDDTTTTQLHAMIDEAHQFFNQHTKAHIEDQHDGTYDIIHSATNIELGSYGRRTYKHLTWLYGTGLAEPRLQRCIDTQ